MDDLKEFALNDALDRKRLHRLFLKKSRIEVRNFLAPSSAITLFKYLNSAIHWRSIVVANEKLQELYPAVPGAQTAEEDSVLLAAAHAGAQTGFAATYDVTRIIGQPDRQEAIENPILARFEAFLNEAGFIGCVRELMAIDSIERCETHAMRFRSGHFVSFHEGTSSADQTGTRRGTFLLSLTPEWKPEWGGLLEFRSRDGSAIEGYVPRFNSLVLYSFPQGNWTSAVTGFAGGPRLAIAGTLHMTSTAGSDCINEVAQ
jgi:Rps23 Pro-64 3,4-dihydroxylase Tpa1-like proline 4-hydroxylase